ncbi:ricin-type beta-trefoil lectin domain protein [Streptomyces sp. NPDC006923]|uniref:ricin-type beta-trefoil lectin domain protein n=1 Tax=Streptomyces sp. NPDC006923 TaxID=3155355 RepID=UPI0034018BA4
MANPEPESAENKPNPPTAHTETDVAPPEAPSENKEADENEDGTAPLPRWETLTAATPGPGGETPSSPSQVIEPSSARPAIEATPGREPSPEASKDAGGGPDAKKQSRPPKDVPTEVAPASVPSVDISVSGDPAASQPHALTAPAGKPTRASHKKFLAAAALTAAVASAIALMTGGGDGDRTTDAKPASDASLPDASTGLVVPGALDKASSATQPTSGKAKEPHLSAGQPSTSSKPPSKSKSSADTSGAGPEHVTADGTKTPPKSATGQGSGSGAGSHHNVKPPPPVDSGVAIWSHASGRCIDVAGGSGAPSGSPLQIRDCDGSASQKWKTMPDGTVRSQGMCMNVGGGSTENGAGISRTTCNGTPAQQFVLNSAHDLVNTHADKCADVKDEQTSNGTSLQIWACGGTDNQKWSTR